MTDDARTTGSGDPKDTPPPSVAPADAAGDRPRTDSPPPPPAAATPQTAVVGAPPPPGGTATAVADPPPPAPPAPVEPRSDRPGIGLLPIALGVGLLAAAIVISAARTRADGDLDWSNYTVGLGATAVLLLVALAALAAGTGRTREELVTWPGAIGILGVGTMVGVGLEDVGGADDWLPYLIGGLVVLLSVVAYAAIRRGAFVVTGILGLGLLYIQLCDDVLNDIGEDDAAIVAAIAITVFVLVITAVGWVLPTRAISGVVAGVVGVVGLNVVLIVLGVQRVAGMIFSGFGSESPGIGGFDGDKPDYDTDVYVILALAALLTLIWALAAALNGNSGFTLLAIAMPATAVPLATFVLAVEHPTWWGVGLAAAGAILLALAGVRQLLARKRT